MATMHEGQIHIDLALARSLVDQQFPEWADLPLVEVASTGTSHAMFRLGRDMVARLPLVGHVSSQVDKEHRLLGRLAPELPMRIPVPLGTGVPSDEYPLPWSVYPWLDGASADKEPIRYPVAAAEALAGFVRALRAIDATDGPAPGEHNFLRGVPLAHRDEVVRAFIDKLHGLVDTADAITAWEESVEADVWDGPPTWFHGDLQPGNVLVRDGRLDAVIDWGGLAAADPAVDLLPVWTMFNGPARDAYAAELEPDRASWLRGRGWALYMGVTGLPYYLETNPPFAALCRHIIDEVLDDFRS